MAGQETANRPEWPPVLDLLRAASLPNRQGLCAAQIGVAEVSIGAAGPSSPLARLKVADVSGNCVAVDLLPEEVEHLAKVLADWTPPQYPPSGSPFDDSPASFEEMVAEMEARGELPEL